MRILVVGTGQTTYYLARQFAANAHEVTVVDSDPAHALSLSRRLRVVVVSGDGTDPVLLEQAGARKADAVLALGSHDHDNLAVCLTAQRKFGVPRTVALVHDPDHEEVFVALGVTVALSATRILAQILESRAGFGSVASIALAAGGRVFLAEILLREGAPAVGRCLRENLLPEGALVGCVIRDGATIVPTGETRLLPGDRLVVIATPDLQADVVQRLTGERG